MHLIITEIISVLIDRVWSDHRHMYSENSKLWPWNSVLSNSNHPCVEEQWLNRYIMELNSVRGIISYETLYSSDPMDLIVGDRWQRTGIGLWETSVRGNCLCTMMHSAAIQSTLQPFRKGGADGREMVHLTAACKTFLYGDELFNSLWKNISFINVYSCTKYTMMFSLSTE